MRGRIPKPTKLKIIQGNPGKRKLNTREPKFSGPAEPPPHVRTDPIALEEWTRRAPSLEKLGLLTQQDQTEFADYCVQHSLYMRLYNKIAKALEEDKLPDTIAAGIYKAFQTASKNRQALAAKFGFTPADRTRLQTPQIAEDDAARYIA